MKHIIEESARIALFVLILYFWLWVLDEPFSSAVNLCIIVGGMLLVFPIAWIGRKMLDRKPTTANVDRVTMFVHYSVVTVAGAAVARALKTHQDWSGWLLPVPTQISWILMLITGAASLLAVVNLALKGLGAPFAVALSRKLAVDWLYVWTRNPMVLAVIAFGLSLGLWFQSTMFVLWVLLLFAPALLVIVRVFEERELEIRFGAPYLEYKSRTPMLFPRKPRVVGRPTSDST